MKKYTNHTGNSGIVAYESGPGFIRVKFRDGDIYRYTNKASGKRNVEMMQQLAEEGRGLATYISKWVKDRYASKGV
ncbi:MAG: hypothetical protein V4616_05785 [Bacteroidota bacterium]